MLRTIIIEDEPAAANLLEEMLKDIDPEVEVIEKCPDLPSGVKSIKRHSPDIVFLDTGGDIQIDRSTLWGLYNIAGTFTNTASITIGATTRGGRLWSLQPCHL